MDRKARLLILVLFVALSLCSLVAQGEFGFAQTTTQDGPVKLDEYGDLSTDDEAARLDLFGDKLFKQPKLSGRIIAYSESQMERGLYLRRLHGIAKYLTDARGIEANRVTVVDGGYREQFATELWLIPEGANPPAAVPKPPQPSVSVSSAYKFDQECLDCSPAVSLYLYGLDEGLQFYAEALRRDPAAHGVLIIRPDHDVSIRRALNEAHKAKGLLIKKYGIGADRVTVKSAGSRKDGTAVVEMWVVPSGATFPTTTANKRLKRTRQ